MTDSFNYPNEPSKNLPYKPPQVEMNAIEKIKTFQVLEVNLRALRRLGSSTASSMSWFTFMAGIFTSSILTWVAGYDAIASSAISSGLFFSVSFMSLSMMVYFYSAWKREKRDFEQIYEEILDRAANKAKQSDV